MSELGWKWDSTLPMIADKDNATKQRSYSLNYEPLHFYSMVENYCVGPFSVLVREFTSLRSPSMERNIRLVICEF